MNKIELLAPAGSLSALEAAVESGADAVYIGGNKFNARAYAENLDEDMLKNAVEYAHIRGVKIYVTVNILILQKEMEELLEYINYLYYINIDAVIVQDVGVAILIKKYLPDFEVHCSTQMAIHNTDGAALLHELGITRVVLARELSLREVDEIGENTGVETEIFVHGALCVCYSGQCYMSSLIGGRSGNRGKCAQPCRKKYRLYDARQDKEITTNQGSYLISTRDLNTYENLYEIADSKAASLKIEGRMKRPEYVAIIVHNYRKALDCIKRGKTDCISKEAAYELKIAFNREFTQGYLFNKRNQEIVNTERPDNRGIFIGKILDQKGNMAEVLLEDGFLNDGDSIEIISDKGKTAGCTISGIKKGNETVKSAKAGDKIRIFITDKVSAGSIVNKTIDSMLFQKAREEYAFKNKKKIMLTGIFKGNLNEFPEFELSDSDGNIAKVIGDEKIQQAQKLAMSEEKISEQLNKTKDTPYVFEKLNISIEPNSFLSVKSVNNLRRAALEQLSEKRITLKQRTKLKIDVNEVLANYKVTGKAYNKANKELIAAVKTLEAGTSAIQAGADCIYLIGDYRYNQNQKLIAELASCCKAEGRSFYYILPQITRDSEVSPIETMLSQVTMNHKELGIVISNISHIKMTERLGITKTRGNFTLNTVNGAAASFFFERGLNSLCVSPELNLSQIADLRKSSEIDLEAMVYGYLPAMVTEYCPSTTSTECVTCGNTCSKSYGIIDDRNKLFRVMNMGNCKNTILNSDVLCVYDNLANIIDCGVNRLRMDFLLEKDNEVYELVKAYKDKLHNLRDNKENSIIEKIKQAGFTKGHYFRGME